MWIFLPGGLLMPAATPTMERDKVVANPTLTQDGRFDLQVRARDETHLTNFIRDYLIPMGLEFSDIEATPQMDYNFRFYMTKQEFALAIAKATLDIDYLKFKPTAEAKGADGKPLYANGHAYHSVLNSIWGTLLRLGAAGGYYGRKSAANPNGYDTTRSLGSSFYSGDYDRDRELDRDWWQEDELDYTPDSVQYRNDLLSEMSDIPVDQWVDYLPAEDYAIIKPFEDEARKAERKSAKAERKRNRRRSRSNTRQPKDKARPRF